MPNWSSMIAQFAWLLVGFLLKLVDQERIKNELAKQINDTSQKLQVIHEQIDKGTIDWNASRDQFVGLAVQHAELIKQYGLFDPSPAPSTGQGSGGQGQT
ncbi:MAG: hypothetical protein NVS9B9_08660 [Ktedonobacteraceae bacterium]